MLESTYPLQISFTSKYPFCVPTLVRAKIWPPYPFVDVDQKCFVEGYPSVAT